MLRKEQTERDFGPLPKPSRVVDPLIIFVRNEWTKEERESRKQRRKKKDFGIIWSSLVVWVVLLKSQHPFCVNGTTRDASKWWPQRMTFSVSPPFTRSGLWFEVDVFSCWTQLRCDNTWTNRTTQNVGLIHIKRGQLPFYVTVRKGTQFLETCKPDATTREIFYQSRI